MKTAVRMPADSWPKAAALACLLLSGAAGLVYEVCWIRRASLVFGSTQEALSTVLAVFFLGLGIGSLAFGRLALSIARPLLLYAILEFALAGLGLASIPLFRWADDAYGGFYRSFSHAPGVLALARIGLVSLAFLLPTVLMGGTLPLFIRQFVSRRSGILGSVGLLYGINTLGAAIGCAMAGAVLMPALGLRSSVALAAGANLVAGISAAALRLAPPGSGEGGASIARASRSGGSGAARSTNAGRVLATLVFLIGFTALAYELVWTRFAGLLIYNTVYTYTTTLTVILAGIVAGSWAGSRFFDRPDRAPAIFGGLQVVSGIAVIGALSAPPGFWQALGHPLVTYGVLMFPPAVLSGASFPLAVRLAVEDPEMAAPGAGRIAMLNTMGGIVGALAAGFFGLPRLGLQTSATVLTATSLVTGFAAWTFLQRSGSAWTRGLAIAASLVAWLAIPRLSGTRVPADYLANRAWLLDFREGKTSNVAVVRRDGRGRTRRPIRSWPPISRCCSIRDRGASWWWGSGRGRPRVASSTTISNAWTASTSSPPSSTSSAATSMRAG